MTGRTGEFCMHPAVVFDILGLLPNSVDKSAVSRRFKQLALTFHPDKGGLASEFESLKLAEESATMYLADRHGWAIAHAYKYKPCTADYRGLRFTVASAKLRAVRAEIRDAARNGQSWDPFISI